MSGTKQTLTIGGKVRTLREKRGYSIRQLRRMTGVEVWRVEQDEFTPTLRTLQRLAEALEVKVSELID